VAAGASDYIGGTTSRRVGTLPCMVIFFSVGLTLALVWLAFSREPAPGPATLLAAAGAGAATTLGLGAFFEATVRGTISIVAPISATGVALPIAIGIARGEQPSILQAAGIVAAVVGIILVVRSPREQGSDDGESGVGLALLSAIGFGLFYWLVAPASRHGVPWAASLAFLVPLLACGVGVALKRPSFSNMLEPRNLGSVVAAAVLGLAGFVLYAFATRHGQLPVVSVLASLFPVVTVGLAYTVLGERVHGSQEVGIVAVLAGVLLMTVA
jgi:drug/metabolite transporter (DMT)-like permease